jgi:hypothetical protein
MQGENNITLSIPSIKVTMFNEFGQMLFLAKV